MKLDSDKKYRVKFRNGSSGVYTCLGAERTLQGTVTAYQLEDKYGIRRIEPSWIDSVEELK